MTNKLCKKAQLQRDIMIPILATRAVHVATQALLNDGVIIVFLFRCFVFVHFYNAEVLHVFSAFFDSLSFLNEEVMHIFHACSVTTKTPNTFCLHSVH